jgi:hypothetical protein
LAADCLFTGRSFRTGDSFVETIEEAENTERPTPNVECGEYLAEFEVGRWALSVRRFLHRSMDIKQTNEDQSNAGAVLKFEYWRFPGPWVLGFGVFRRCVPFDW